ncbi:MAG: site-2 protease family protein [Mogibacterium sp.]|nr:site-2 protease family protein [Mogibacterium sp.]
MKRFFQSGNGILLILLLAMSFMNRGLQDPKTYFLNMLISLPGIIIGLSFHEFGHAFVSTKLGDPTPRMQGRVTLDPRAHIDPFGFLALVFCGFGWGVPVQIDPRYYKHPRRDELLVSLAGVTMNLILAVAFSFLAHLMVVTMPSKLAEGTLTGTLFDIVIQVVIINIILMIFNLIPVPPLDGFGVITQLFNLRSTSWYYKVYQNGYMILMLLLLLGVVDNILSPGVNAVFQLLVDHIIL